MSMKDLHTGKGHSRVGWWSANGWENACGTEGKNEILHKVNDQSDSRKDKVAVPTTIRP